MENTCVYSSGNAGGSYIYSLHYNEYIENKIKNEEALARQVGQYIPVNEAAYKNIRAITEAKATDRIKNKMQKIGQFIKNLIGKFMEAMTHILLDEKEYLEKYKDIILKKRPKDGMKYSYTGDYDKAINRCINTTVPVFNYATHATALKQDGNGAIVKLIMHDKEFTYDESDSEALSTQFKEYFLASENDKESSGDFSELNFTNMYNFCYNFKKIEEMTKKDQNYITQSTTAIVNAANQRIKDNAAAKPASTEAKPPSETSEEQPKQNVDASFRFDYGNYFIEAEDKPKSGVVVTDDTKKEEDNASKNTNAVSQMGSTTTNHEKLSDDAAKANAAGSDGETEDEMYKIGDKFTTVCNTLIAAKCTAVQQIAKDYMTIIRAHVKSYVGNTDNKADDRTAKAGTNYQKDKNNDNSNQQGENGSGEQEQKKPQQTGIKTIDQINAEIADLTDKIDSAKLSKKADLQKKLNTLRQERQKLLNSNK